MSIEKTNPLQVNGVYMFRNLASGKYLNVYGNDQVSANRNVCQWEASADLSQLWQLYKNGANHYKIASVMRDSSKRLYTLNVYRSVHKNADIYIESTSNDPDSAVEIETFGAVSGYNFSGEKVKIRLHSAEKDGSYLYLTAVGNENGSGVTTSIAEGNVIWKAGSDSDAHQFWVAEYFTDYPSDDFDLRKFGAQVFLKKMYQSEITVDAKASTRLCRELIRALQIELGVTLGENESYGNFGPKTENLCPILYKGCTIKAEIVKILCHALFCKGYSTTSIYDTFNSYVEAGVVDLQLDIGLEPTGKVTPKLFKAILNTDGYKCAFNGDNHVFMIQKNLNHDYWDYSGIIACDGRFSRDTNKAIIYALQKEVGISADQATGTFGPSTTARCPSLPLPEGSSLNEENLIKILQYGLYANGYNQSGTFDGVFTNSVLQDVQSFQSFMAYSVKNVADMDTIKGLLASCGNTERSASACDTATILDKNSAKILYNAGYRYVGRYLTGTVRTANGQRVAKSLTRNEAENILSTGLNIIPIYQDGGTYPEYFTRERGTIDAGAAISTALALGFPKDTIIYFAVDCDLYGYQVDDIVEEYFYGIKNYFKTYNADESNVSYKIGVYGPRYTCTHIYADSCYVSDMSTGYSGNLGFKMPDKWAFDQFVETSVQGIPIDKVAVSGRDAGVSELKSTVETIEEQKKYAILHKACDFREDIELLNLFNISSMSFDIPVVVCPCPGLELKLTLSEKFQKAENAIFNITVDNGNISTTQKVELDNYFTAATTGDVNIADYMKKNNLGGVEDILRGMSVSLQNGNISISYGITANSFTWSICASTDKLPLPMNEQCEFSLTLSLTVKNNDNNQNSEGAFTFPVQEFEMAVAAAAIVCVTVFAALNGLPVSEEQIVEFFKAICEFIQRAPMIAT